MHFESTYSAIYSLKGNTAAVTRNNDELCIPHQITTTSGEKFALNKMLSKYVSRKNFSSLQNSRKMARKCNISDKKNYKNLRVFSIALMPSFFAIHKLFSI